MYNVTPSKLHIAARGEATEKAILGLSFERGRAVRLTNEEEKFIVDATLGFKQNCTPLDCRSFPELARTLIRTLSAARRDKLGFKNDLPGIDWQNAFIKRHPQLTLRRRVNLEHERSEAMNPENVAKHFSRIRALMDKHDIHCPTRIFNLDESGF